MAEFISNSAILTTIRPSAVLAANPWADARARNMADFRSKSAIIVFRFHTDSACGCSRLKEVEAQKQVRNWGYHACY